MKMLFIAVALSVALLSGAQAGDATPPIRSIQMARDLAEADHAVTQDRFRIAQLGTTGFGSGFFGVAISYVGPGDIFSTSPLAAYSCAEAYTAAWAGAGNKACKIVDTATGTFSCDTVFASNGKVDLTTPYCTGGTLSVVTFCTVTHAAGCSVTTAYDQSGNGRDAVQATLANMPAYTLSSTPTGTLPALNCGAGATTTYLQTAGNVTQAQPFTFYAVAIRNGNFTTAQGFFGSGVNNGDIIGASASANTWQMYGGISLTRAASDSAWHAGSGLANGASGVINIDGAETTGTTSSTGLAAETLRLCRGGLLQTTGLVAEAAFWGASTNSTNRNAISTNAHSSGRYNF